MVCSEHQPFTQFDQESLGLDIPIISWENSDLEEFEETCLALGFQHIPNALEILPSSEIPTLLLSGNFDPITPPEYGELALESFPNGKHLIDPIGSHGIAFNDECLDSIMNQFLINPNEELLQFCLKDPDRRNEVVPSTALSSLFMQKKKDIPSLLMFIPVIMALLGAPRYFIIGIKWIWKKIKKINGQLIPEGKQLRIRFELTNWVFGLCSFGLGYGLDQIRRPDIFRYALALPEDTRVLLVIPLIILLLTPMLVYFTFRTWRKNSSVMSRLYLLLNSILVLIIGGIIVFNDMLLTWTR